MKALIWIAVAFFSLAGSAWAVPRTVTIAQLRAHPWRYAEQQVRVRGQINQCWRWSCDICPEGMTPETYDPGQCLGIRFGLFEPGRSEARDGLAIEAAYRWTVITISAHFHPDCLASYQTHLSRRRGGQEVEEVVCMDRVSHLRQARVLAFHSRKTDRTGLHNRDKGDRLHVATGADEVAMLEAFGREWPSGVLEKRERVALIQDKPSVFNSVQREGYICECLKETSCGELWPQWNVAPLVGLAASPAPYDCYNMLEWDNRWRLLP